MTYEKTAAKKISLDESTKEKSTPQGPHPRLCSVGLPSNATPQQVEEASAVPQLLHSMMLATTQAITHSLQENLSPLVNSQAHLLAMVQQIGQMQTFQASAVEVSQGYLQGGLPGAPATPAQFAPAAMPPAAPDVHRLSTNDPLMTTATPHEWEYLNEESTQPIQEEDSD